VTAAPRSGVHVELSAPSGLTTTVDYTTSDVPRFPPRPTPATLRNVDDRGGESTGTFSVPVVGDTLYEGERALPRGAHDRTKRNRPPTNDYAAFGNSSPTRLAPGGSSPTPSVPKHTGTTPQPSPCRYQRRLASTRASTTRRPNGTADAPDDYAATSGIVTIPAGADHCDHRRSRQRRHDLRRATRRSRSPSRIRPTPRSVPTPPRRRSSTTIPLRDRREPSERTQSRGPRPRRAPNQSDGALQPSANSTDGRNPSRVAAALMSASL